MTVSSTAASQTFACDGATVAFTCPFRALSSSEVRAYLITISTGARVLLANGVDYVVTGAGTAANVLVTTTTAYSSLYQLKFKRATNRLQETDYRDNDPFPAESHENGLDRGIMIAQEHDEALLRTIRAPDGEPLDELPSAADRALKMPGFDAQGRLVVSIPSAGSAASLALLLASISSLAEGAGMLGFNPLLGYIARTIGADLRTFPSIDSFANVDPTGAADSAAAINAAIAAAAALGVKGIRFSGTYLVSVSILGASRLALIGHAGATIKTNAADISLLSLSGKSGSRVEGIKFWQTAAGANSQVAAVDLTNATDCHVSGCEMVGMQWAGVWLNRSARCSVRECYMHGWNGAVQDAADVCVYQDAVDCIVWGNWLFGGGEHGVLVQDPYSVAPLLPKRNLIAHNVIGQHTGYGAILYMPAQNATFTASIAGTTLTVTAVSAGTLAVGQRVSNAALGTSYGYITALGTGAGGTGTYTLDTAGAVASTAIVTTTPTDTFNRFIANQIFDIQGSFATNRSSGAAMYLAGDGIGATICAQNVINNCCVQTLNRSLTPAGIGVNGVQVGCTKPVLSDNVISGMTQGDGILVASSPGGCKINGGLITIPSTNNGTGVGGASLTGTGVRVDGSNNVSVETPDVEVRGSGNAVFAYANGVNMSDITITGGRISAAAATPLRVDQNGGFAVSNFVATGVRAKTTSDAVNAVQLASINGGLIEMNASCGSSGAAAAALSISSCTQLRVPGGSYLSTGTVQVATTGVCTGGFMSKAAYWGTAAAGMGNGATGFSVEWLTTAQPAAGTWARGDHWVQTASTSGAAPGGYCTVAGTSGTWKNEAALA